MTGKNLEAHVEAVLKFNRFYGRRIASLLDPSQESLPAGGSGAEAGGRLKPPARSRAAALLKALRAEDQKQMVGAMATIQRLLAEQPAPPEPCTLRPHRPGDMGWIVERHGFLYHREYGWGRSFEALVAQIAADFLENFDADRERCWIAEAGGMRVGSVCLVKKSEAVAKLRLLLVEPRVRGLGIGKLLVDACLSFARQAGYRKVTLWTDSLLVAARHIYETAGFQLMEEFPERIFGHDLVGQTWELEL